MVKLYLIKVVVVKWLFELSKEKINYIYDLEKFLDLNCFLIKIFVLVYSFFNWLYNEYEVCICWYMIGWGYWLLYLILM